jgi:hypothetical protein
MSSVTGRSRLRLIIVQSFFRTHVTYGGAIVKFKALLDHWKTDPPPVRTAREYAMRLPLEDAARLHALAELFPGNAVEALVTDLLHAALDEIVAAMPYEAGPKIISRDDQGDPVYEDVGLTPRFAELTRKLKKTLQAGP